MPILLTAVLAGCSHSNYQQRGPGDAVSSDFDALVEYRASIATRTSAARAEECRRLLKYQQQAPELGRAVRLMIARPLSYACGDPGQLARSYELLRSRQYDNRATEGMGNYYAKVMQRMGSPSHTAKSDTPPKSGKDESRILREKLEALRAIERDMDERSSENSSR